MVYKNYIGRYNQNKYVCRKSTRLLKKDLFDETFDLPDGETYGEFFSLPPLGYGP